MSGIQVAVPRSYTGVVTVAVNAGLKQRAVLDIRRSSNNQQIETVTFEGKGERTTAKNTTDGLEYWSFGPWGYPATVYINTTHEKNGSWIGSDMKGPFTINTLPTPNYPTQFAISTVTSEDRLDADHNDCVVQVVLYK